jgi:transposase
MLGDGADWIWNQVTSRFPKAIQILDWFHASEHLMPVAQAAFATDLNFAQIK